MREFPRQAQEVLLDVGGLMWVTVLIVNKVALVLASDRRETLVVMRSDKKKFEVNAFLKDEFEVMCTVFLND